MKDIAILSISFVWIISFLWFNRAWKHLYVGEHKTLIFLFTPFMLPLYLYYAMLHISNSPKCISVSYKIKRKICKIRKHIDFYDWICFFLPLARVEFYNRCLHQFYYDIDPCWSDSIAEIIKNIIANISRCLPFNYWGNICGQELIISASNSKYLTTDSCRLYDESNVYFEYDVCFGRLRIIRTEFFNNETGKPANYFMNGFIMGESLTTKKEIIFSRFIFTKKQAFKAFKDLHEKFPNLWNDTFWSKYSSLIEDLKDALNWMNKKDDVAVINEWKFEKGFTFSLLVMISTMHITEEDLDIAKNKLIWKIQDNHKHLNKAKLSFEIKAFIEELKKYPYKPKMIWERI